MSKKDEEIVQLKKRVAELEAKVEELTKPKTPTEPKCFHCGGSGDVAWEGTCYFCNGTGHCHRPSWTKPKYDTNNQLSGPPDDINW